MGLWDKHPERGLWSKDDDADPFRGWRLTVYPSAGEAGGRFYSGSKIQKDDDLDDADPDTERSAIEGARRARGKVRRYCAANGLNRLGTLTYEGDGCHDPLVIRTDLADFFRKLRRTLGGDPFPYVWVPEWHKSHGLHAHFAVGQFVKRFKIEEAWGRGFVHIKLIGDLPVNSSARDEARAAAHYLSKYVGKAFDDRRVAARHRYDLGQGFQPDEEPIEAATLREVVHLVSRRMGTAPARFWHSGEVDDWAAPPAVHLSWS